MRPKISCGKSFLFISVKRRPWHLSLWKSIFWRYSIAFLAVVGIVSRVLAETVVTTSAKVLPNKKNTLVVKINNLREVLQKLKEAMFLDRQNDLRVFLAFLLVAGVLVFCILLAGFYFKNRKRLKRRLKRRQRKIRK